MLMSKRSEPARRQGLYDLAGVMFVMMVVLSALKGEVLPEMESEGLQSLRSSAAWRSPYSSRSGSM